MRNILKTFIVSIFIFTAITTISIQLCVNTHAEALNGKYDIHMDIPLNIENNRAIYVAPNNILTSINNDTSDAVLLSSEVNGTCGDNVIWELDYDGTLTISGNGDMFSGNDLAPWYTYRQYIDKVVIKEGVTSIGYAAFRDCINLNEVLIPNSVNNINAWAFSQCSKLEKIDLPINIQAISESTFFHCESLKEITIPESVTEIGYRAFGYCYSLSSILIPTNVKTIGSRAFISCTNLTEIKVSSTNPSYKSIQGVLFNYEETELLCYPAGKTGSSYNIPEKVECISEFAFAYNSNLDSVLFSSTAKTIGDLAFYYCTSLSNIELSNALTSIGYQTFTQCQNLRKVYIPKNVSSIDYSAFYNCSNLAQISVDTENKYYKSENNVLFNHQGTELLLYPQGNTNDYYYIPKNVSSIGPYAFCNCKYLNSISLPDGLLTISQAAFTGCIGITEITLPSSVKVLGSSAFFECTSMTKATVLSDDVKYSSYSVFYSCSSDLVLYGNIGSTTQEYADRYNITFKTLSGDPVVYIISYDSNGGKNAPDAQVKTKGDDLNLSKSVPQRDGYVFLGWSEIKTSSTVEYQPGDLYSADMNITLYAVWQRIGSILMATRNANCLNITVSNHTNGNLIAAQYDNRNRLKYVSTTTLNPYTTNYTVDILNAGYRVKVMLWDNMKNITPLTVSCEIEPNCHNVSYNLNYGTNQTYETEAVPVNSTAYGPDVPKREGFIFGGWYQDKECITPFDFENERVNSDITLYALWNTEDYTYLVETSEDCIDFNDDGIAYASNEILLTAEDETYANIELIAKEYNGKITGYIPITGDYKITLTNNYKYNILEKLCTQIEQTYGLSVYVNNIWKSEETYTPNDYPSNKYEIDAPRNWHLEAVKAKKAWDFRNDLLNVRVGIIDSMFDTSHSDLTFAKTWCNPQNVSDLYLTAKKELKDTYSHGTHVAGIIGAEQDNGIGTTGIAINSNMYGYALKGNSEYSGYMDLKVAIANMVMNNVKVINFSQGYSKNKYGEWYSVLASCGDGDILAMMNTNAYVMTKFLKKLTDCGKDFVIVASAGNENDKDANHDILAEYNSVFTHIYNSDIKKRIIVVGACNKNKVLADYSNVGDRVDVIAPGSCIYSTIPGDGNTDDGYGTMTGTSMAAPIVSGIAAMVWGANPSLTGQQVRAIIKNTATTDIKDTDVNMVNAYLAIKTAKEAKVSDIPLEEEIGIVNVQTIDSITKKTVNKAHISITKSSTGLTVIEDEIDENGEFTALLPGNSDYILEIKSDYNTYKKTFRLENRDALDYLCELEYPLVSGVLYSNEWNTIGGANISIYQNNQWLLTEKTDNNGLFKLNLKAGDYTLQISKSGYATITKNITVIIDTDNSLGKILMPEGVAILSGTVEDEEKVPIVGANVTLTNGDTTDSVFTDSSGNYQFSAVAGDYSIIVTAQGYLPYSEKVTINSAYQTSLNITLGKDVHDDVIKIYSAEDFNNIRNNLDKDYILMNDIDLSEYCPWLPIGDQDNNIFTGSLNGNGHIITGFKGLNPISCVYNSSGTKFSGLFGWLDASATVENLTVDADNVTLGISSYAMAGLICGGSKGIIRNCTVTGSLKLVDDFGNGTIVVGGIAGNNYGRIVDCKNKMTTVTANTKYTNYAGAFAGGIAGNDIFSSGGTIQHCWNEADISVSGGNSYNSGYSAAGGISAYGTANNCCNVAKNISAETASRISRNGGNNNISYDTRINNTYVSSSNTGLNTPNGKTYTYMNEMQIWFDNQ